MRVGFGEDLEIMSEIPYPTEERHSSKRLILPSLTISRFVTRSPGVITSLLLIDIGRTFGSSVGITAQIITVASSVTAIFALIIGALSVRVSHKSLLLTGISFYCISAIGCAFAPTFTILLVFYSISGLGLGMIAPMMYTLIAAYFPLEQRTSAIGWAFTGASLASIIGAPIIGIMAEFKGWRFAFMGFLLPISLLSLILVLKGLPSLIQNPPSDKGKYLDGFKLVFSNSSAMACVGGSALGMAATQAIGLYSVSFIRERYSVPLEFASLLILGTAVCSILGNQVSGRTVNKFGRQPVTVLMTFVTGVFIITYMIMPNLWLALAFVLLGRMFSSIMFTAGLSLTLEQVPGFRSVLMSLSVAIIYLGASIGAGIGGLSFLWLGYEGVGLSLGALGIAAAILFYFLANDPTNT